MLMFFVFFWSVHVKFDQLVDITFDFTTFGNLQFLSYVIVAFSLPYVDIEYLYL